MPQDPGGSQIGQLMVNIGQGLETIVQGLGKAGAPEEAVEAFNASLDAFKQGMEALGGPGGEPQGEAPATSSPEAGGRPGAMSMNPGMRR